MADQLKKFPDQLMFEPAIDNADKLTPAKYFVAAGMGGSHLAASLIKDIEHMDNLTIHSDYGLPHIDEYKRKETLFVAVSHSGNTEETIGFANAALKEDLKLAIITGGGKLKELAHDNKLPFIALPDNGLPPRLSTGYMAAALLTLFGMNEKLAEMKFAAKSLSEKYHTIATEGQKTAALLFDHIPLVYSSEKNFSLAYYWKIAMDETAKVPAFANKFPELDHNELAGFTLPNSGKPYCLVTIHDAEDDGEQIEKRMRLTSKLIEEHGAKTVDIRLEGKNRLEKFWRSVYLAVCTSFALAGLTGVDPLGTEFIESFKSELGRQPI
ncbi:hypothetical protein KGQ27_01490 [Patescibacteria group bacterium]|nr:hypothetical protein [Patescibacteria group bacterium]MDE1946485.1 hypothetical protein [Patescibacteria group bacterium]MDE2011163.1 hypothetical protein [Patescibacteria group bacterium]MDE2233545.1 hypothetical protein [Patescibacteria group bacterium]